MLLWLQIAALPVVFSAQLSADANIVRSGSHWELANGEITLKLVREAGDIKIESLRRLAGPEWAATGASIRPLVAAAGDQTASPNTWNFRDDSITSENGARQLVLRFEGQEGALLSLVLRIYPRSAVLEFAARLENKSSRTLPLVSHIDALSLTFRNPPSGGLMPFSSVAGKHGFYPAGALPGKRQFKDWLVVQNSGNGESALVGGEAGLGVFDWIAVTETVRQGLLVRAGNVFRDHSHSSSPSSYEVAPGQVIETPLAFLAIAKGDPDNAGNEAFRYLRRYVFPKPVPNSPQATYCVWLTEANVEETLRKEVAFAKSVGFDLFYHDATWYEGASVVPGTNNWTQGLGSYRENSGKFPHGIRTLSDEIRSAGMKFGIWVDPGNVDASRVESGEIPRKWLAEINGKVLRGDHPSLTPTLQLCLGDPEVVDWVEKKLDGIVSQWGLEWLKWDPSATVSYACDRTDHGHSARGGAYASYRGHLEILSYLMSRHPNLSGFEVDPSLRFSRTNPGPRDLLPGGYIDEFISGPMLSPRVWGSFGTFAHGEVSGDRLGESWYSASALDYHIRKHLTHGFSFGNINGMAAQLLSAAPAGYIDALKRNLIAFKQYRSLLLEDVYHPKTSAGQGWSAIEYVNEDLSEAVLFVFRDKSQVRHSTIWWRGLDPDRDYRLRSLNQQPGRETNLSGRSAMSRGVTVELPDPWLAKGDKFPESGFEDQLKYGSDILLLEPVR